MSPEELGELVRTGGIDTVVMAFTDHYGRLMGKRLDAGFFLDEALDHGTHGCDYLLTVDMEMEPVDGYDFTSWEHGYGDVHLVPDRSTLRRAAWADRTAIVLCDVAHDGTGEPVDVAPRSILRRQIGRAAGLGLEAKAASELEFFLYRDSYRAAHDKGYAGLDAAGWYIEDYHLFQGARVEDVVGASRRVLRDSEIPVESSKGEWGRGQHELNIRYADLLAMADRHALLKEAVKEVAEAHGCAVTFMAKPHTDEAGSSCHVHLSLWADGTNAFDGPHTHRGPSGRSAFGASDTFRWFLGGWMTHLRDLMAFYAPTVNSYKRYQDGSWAPTRIAWSRDNRTAGFRVVGSGASLRIECRIAGADVNPYLVYAAALASGLDGIDQRIEPPPSFDGDVYGATDLPHVPTSLAEAVAVLRSSTAARRLLGDAVVEHYAHAYEVEVAAFETSVTDWERSRYFERI